MTSCKHWGEIEPLEDENNKEIDNQALENTLTNLSIGGPMKLHQPYSSEDGTFIQVPPECSRMEANITQSVKLLERIRNHFSGGNKVSSKNGKEADKNFLSHEVLMDTDEAENNEKMYKHKIKEDFMGFDRGYSSFVQSHHATPTELRSHVARQILQKSVAALVAHAGYDTSLQFALETTTDVTHYFMQRLTRLLRIAVDREAQAGPHGFPDAVEWAFFEAGLGSVTTLHNYYQESVLGQRAHLEALANTLPPPPPSPPTQQEPLRLRIKEEVQDEEEEDNVPEIHFPALGNGEASEEMQSSLEPGFQMLHSLEEGALG